MLINQIYYNKKNNIVFQKVIKLNNFFNLSELNYKHSNIVIEQESTLIMLKRAFLVSSLTIGGLFLMPETNFQSINSIKKAMNTAVAGAKMAYIYRYNNYSHDQIINMAEKHHQASQYLRDALAKNGGIYIKLGQLIATLDVIVPDQYRETLSALTRKGKVSSYDKVIASIQKQFGKPMQELFSEFDKQPISSASIAQVYKAKLLNGEEVAVKVQHPTLQSSVQSDLAIMSVFVKLAKKMFPEFSYGWLIEEFQKNLKKELDFKHQAQNGQKLALFLQKQKYLHIKIPKIIYPVTKKVLIMEFINGVHIDQVQKMKQMKIDTKKIGRSFAKANIQMIHKYGFVHADTHSGNLKVRKNKKGEDQLVILDHGLYQQLTPQLKKTYNQFWLGLITKDQKMFTEAAQKLGTKNGKILCSMLTSKSIEELSVGGKQRFKLLPENRQAIMHRAAELHEDIIRVLNELNRDILLLLKVNQFARTIQNQLGGRQMAVFEDIARCCVDNLSLSWWRKLWIYFKIYWINK